MFSFGSGARVEAQRKELRKQVEHPTMNREEGKEEWLRLCEQAAVEQDPERLMFLTQEICRLLEEREKMLKGTRRP